RYSTSFSLGIRFLNSNIHEPIYAIYGFVRFADEIVDSFHGYDKEKLLNDFKKQTFEAIETGISLNPILNSFQHTVNKYKKYYVCNIIFNSFTNAATLNLNEKRIISKRE
ncbi:MAG: squalene/phytoene synthase family protein, partial [bacterium]